MFFLAKGFFRKKSFGRQIVCARSRLVWISLSFLFLRLRACVHTQVVFRFGRRLTWFYEFTFKIFLLLQSCPLLLSPRGQWSCLVYLLKPPLSAIYRNHSILFVGRHFSHYTAVVQNLHPQSSAFVRGWDHNWDMFPRVGKKVAIFSC